MLNFKRMKIRKRLTTGFILIIAIASISSIVGIIAMLNLSSKYTHALKNYGFSQGDIGKAMTAFAETRSALRAVIGYDDNEDILKVKNIHEQQKENFQNHLKNIVAIVDTDEEKILYENIINSLDEYWDVDSNIISIGATTDREKCEEAQDIALNQLSPMYEKINSDLIALMDLNVNTGNDMNQSLAILQIILIIVIVVIIIISVLLSLNLGSSIAKGIEKPLIALGARLRTFAQGDLSSPFPNSDTEDEVADIVKDAQGMAENLQLIVKDAGELLDFMAEGNFAISTKIENKYVGDFELLLLAMRKMNRQMSDTLRHVDEAAKQVSIGSSNMAQASQALAEGATDQAASVEEMQATVANITEGIQRTAKHVEQSYQQAQKYAAEADHSREEMEAMVDAMNRISETSQKIENIITEIEDIASQTNLLSLNAAIEAARAGEAGRGFSVVAEQIRKLAEQSAQSAVDTRQLIEGSMQEVTEGNKAAERAAASMEEVVKGVKMIAQSSKELSNISSEQAIAMEQAEAGIVRISEVVQSNSASAEETSATSDQLSTQAAFMGELVDSFTLRKDS